MRDVAAEAGVSSIRLYLDEAAAPFATYRPPASVRLDTTTLADGPHELHVEAEDALGNVGRRTIPFVVQNGPGITVTGLRAGERVGGSIALEINAFGAEEPFDPVRAESSGPVPVWTWVMAVIVLGWAAWYGLAYFPVPPSFAATPTYENNPVAVANAPMSAASPAHASGKGVAAGFDYGATGARLYAANCASCHGPAGAGVPHVFPALANDAVVTASDARAHIRIVLHGLNGKAIGGIVYAAQMPAFAQLGDNDVAAIVDHERTSWGNNAPVISPDEVKRAR